MITLDGDRVIYFDVDDTLVLWPPLTRNARDEDLVLIEGQSLLPHERHILELKALKRMGAVIVVWSSGGGTWCEQVIEALGLTEFVDLCVSKPLVYYDDINSSQFMTTRIYLEPPP